jgi:hypothetical protein
MLLGHRALLLAAIALTTVPASLPAGRCQCSARADEVRIYDVDLSPAEITSLYMSNTRTQTMSWGAIKSRYR